MRRARPRRRLFHIIPSDRAPVVDAKTHKAQQRSPIPSLRDAASLINSGGDLGTILRDLLLAACRHSGWTMGSIMSIDEAHGQAYVIVRHDPAVIQRVLPDRWELATSPSVVALQRNEPVFIGDAQSSDEFPGYRRDATEREYRSVLVMPMSCADEDGRPMVLTLISRAVREVAPDDLAFIGMIVHLGEIAVEKQHRLLQEKLEAEWLQNALQAHTILLEQALAESSVSSLATKVSDLLPNPVAVVDFSGNLIVAGRSPSEAHFDDLTWHQLANAGCRHQLMRAARRAVEHPQSDAHTVLLDVDERHVRISFRVEPLTIDAETVGALMIFSTPHAFGKLDRLVLSSAKLALSVQMMRSFIRFRFETRTLTDLFMEVVEKRWHDEGDVIGRAQRLGVSLASPQVMALIDLPETAKSAASSLSDPHHVLIRLFERQEPSASVIAVEDGLVCLLPAGEADDQGRPDKILRRIVEELGRYFTDQPAVVRAGTCRTLGDYPTAWQRGRRMARIGRSFGQTGLLGDRDFGPLPILVSAADGPEVRGFVDESIGAVAAYDRQNGTPYMATLFAFLREGCRSQACADAMGLHVTTLRYRLSRIEELFGITLDTPERRFAIELAMRLHGIIDQGAMTET